MNMIIFVILPPLISFFILVFFKNKLSQLLSGCIGIGSIVLSNTIILYTCSFFFENHIQFYIKNLFLWVDSDNFKISFSFLLDSLSLTMLFLVGSIGLLIHLFSFWYIQFKNDSARFFAYMNLFMASMFILVLANNLLVMYLGWEGVGVCSYCLISFYYNNSKNYYSAMKAFLITRIGDIFLLIAILMLYVNYGTVDFQSLNLLINSQLIHNTFVLEIITFFLLLGAVGKSAQFPLHTWLADAMVGPTPVSALIHAATMITAGIYLIIRTHFLFLLTPFILKILGLFGLLTLIISSFSALVQKDIKKILAYSTMNQISYMFLALSMTFWNVAMMHLISHAIFKSLLFLSSGSLILFCGNEKNIFKIGGLRTKIPLIYICFLIGGASLIAFPIFTFSFYTKENILFSFWYNNNLLFLIIGLLGTVLTSIYTFRMIFLLFHGSKTMIVKHRMGFFHTFPLLVLILFSTVLGIFIFPKLNLILPEKKLLDFNPFYLKFIAEICSIVGVFIAYFYWIKHKNLLSNFFKNKIYFLLYQLFIFGFGLDCLYNFLFNKFYIFIAKKLSNDPLGVSLEKSTTILFFLNKLFSIIVNGYLRWYILFFMMGSLLFLFPILLIHY